MATSHAVNEQRVVAKVFRRLMPWCMAAYILSYLDRVNIGFAALTMNADLGLTATMFGLATTLFYLVYVALEVPSTMMLARVGARRWIPRIMITWGLAAAATAFVAGPTSLYAIRLLIGAAEAGLTPGLLFYLSQWFPKAQRAKVNALFLASMPLALLIGAPVSGLIMKMDGLLGLAGWRWVFICEGLPSVLLGIAIFFHLPSRPQEAKWLSPEEQEALVARVALDHAPPRAAPSQSVWREVATPMILLLSLAYFCIQANINTLGIWTPQIIKEFAGGSVLTISLLSALPPLAGVLAMLGLSVLSDRTERRASYVMAALAVGAAGWILMALAAHPAVKFCGLMLAFSGMYAAIAVFWATVTSLIAQRGQAVGVSLISSLGTIASIVSPLVIGKLRDVTQSFTAGLWYVAVLALAGILALAVAGAGKPRAA